MCMCRCVCGTFAYLEALLRATQQTFRVLQTCKGVQSEADREGLTHVAKMNAVRTLSATMMGIAGPDTCASGVQKSWGVG